MFEVIATSKDASVIAAAVTAVSYSFNSTVATSTLTAAETVISQCSNSFNPQVADCSLASSENSAIVIAIAIDERSAINVAAIDLFMKADWSSNLVTHLDFNWALVLVFKADCKVWRSLKEAVVNDDLRR